MKRIQQVLVLIILLFSSFFPVVVSQSAIGPIIQIGDYEAGRGDILKIPIIVQNTNSDVKAVKTTLEYDPKVLKVIGIGNSDFNFESYRKIDNVNGKTEVGLVNTQTTTLTGTVQIIEFECMAIGSFNSATTLKLKNTSLKDASDKEIIRTIKDGTALISSAHEDGVYCEKTDTRIQHVYGIKTYERHDGITRDYAELNIINGNYPYLVGTHQVQKDGTTLNLPTKKDLTYEHVLTARTAKIKPVFTFNAYAPSNFIKNNNTSGHITLPWSSSTGHTIKGEQITTGPFTWDSGIRIIDGNKIELPKADYSVELSNTQINVTHWNNSYFENAAYPVRIEFDSWTVGIGGDPWSSSVQEPDPDYPITFVQCTGKVELDILVNNVENITMVSYWRFDNDTIVDENTTSGNDGTNYGADYTTGVYGGGSYWFVRGNSDYMDMGNDDSLNNITEDFIIDTWIWYDSGGFDYDSYIITKNLNAYTDTQYGLWRGSGDAIRLYMNGAYRVKSDTDVGRGAWYHLVGLRRVDSPSDPRVAEIYIDGEYNVDGSNEYDTDLTRTTHHLWIGRRASTLYFKGAIDNPRICTIDGTLDEDITDIVDWMYWDTKVMKGNLTSNIRDTGSNLNWVDLSVNADIPGNTSIDLYVNTSGDNSTWTGRQLVQADAAGDGTIYEIPEAYQDRYGQWEIILNYDGYENYTGSSVHYTPAIENVTLGLEVLTTPGITNVTSQPDYLSALISWDVNQTTDNRVEYGVTTSLGSWSTWDNDTDAPSITIGGLTNNVTYYYSVWSYNDKNSTITANSTISSFKTWQYGTPIISNVVSQPYHTYAIISWDVNQTANNRIEYGLNASLGSWSTWNNSTDTPNLTLGGLTTDTTYYYSVWSHSLNDTAVSSNSSISSFKTLITPKIISWSNNRTNTDDLILKVPINKSVNFNVTSDQNITAWTWNLNGINYSTGHDNLTVTYDTDAQYTLEAYGTNGNGTTNVVPWEVEVGDMQNLIYRQNEELLEEARMIGLSILLTVLILVGLTFFLVGVLTPNSILTLLGSFTFFSTMLLPIPVLADYAYFGIALTMILLLFGVIGIIITFYQWFTTYTEENSFRKWDNQY